MSLSRNRGAVIQRHGRRSPAVLLLSRLAFALALPATVSAQAAASDRPIARAAFAAHVTEAAQRFGIPAAWIRAVMRAESANDPRAVSPKGAIGLMQIMPATWVELRVRHGLGHDPYDPRDNILAGAAYLRELHDRYGTPGFLAAYNAGPGRYEEHLATGRALPAETRAYVAALVPFSGGGEVAPVVVAAADPLAWTRAPLFVAQADRTASANLAPPDRGATEAPVTPVVRDVSAIIPPSGGLFVARAEAGGPR